MGMFGNLMNKIFHAGAEAERPVDAAQPGVRPVSQVEARNLQEQGSTAPGGSTPAAATGAQGTTGGAPAASVDVAQVLDGMAAKKGEKLDWRHSIVDLMKVVDMDSSLSARKELAADLQYSGDTNDSAAMNMWLHKEVMRRFKENGGKLPADLDAR